MIPRPFASGLASHSLVSQAKLLNKLFGLLLAVCFSAFYWPRLLWMFHIWRSDGIYSFAFLVPVFSACLVFIKRGRLKELAPRPSKTGVLIVAMSVSLTIILDRSKFRLFSATPILIVGSVAGTVWAVWGMEALRILAFPIGFLLFLVPLPPLLVRAIDYPLQELCTRVTATLAHMCRIEAQQMGAVLYLPNFTMQIVPACNGLRSAVAMLAVAVVYGYLVRGPLYRKLLLIALAIPSAYLANFVRLFCDVFVTNALGSRFLPYEAAYDYVWGFLIFVSALFFLFAFARLLRCNKFRAIS